MNKKLRKLLKSKGKSVYGLYKFLGLKSPQAAEYIVKKKDLSAEYGVLKGISEYLDVEVEDIID